MDGERTLERLSPERPSPERPSPERPSPERPSPERPSAVGALLRSCRSRSGLTIADVSRSLRIRQAFLVAIEDGRFSDLPGPAYALGFLRAYADFLGLDGNEVVRRFRAETAAVSGSRELHFPKPDSESSVPKTGILLVGLLIAAVGYGGWYLLSSSDTSISDIVGPLPERLAGLVPGSGTDSEGAEIIVADPAPQALPSPGAVSDGDPSQWPVAPDEGGAAGQGSASAVATTGDGAVERMPVTPPPPVEPPREAGTPTDRTTSVPAQPIATPLPPESPAGVADAIEPAPVPPVARVAEPAPLPEGPEPGPAGDVVSGTAVATTTGTVSGARGEQQTATASTSSPGSSSPPDSAGGEAAGPGGSSGLGAGSDPGMVLRATEASWIEIRDPSGARLLSRILKPGETYDVPDREGLVMTVGNAGGLVVTIDGQVLPALGGSGVVLRRLPLDPVSLRAAAGDVR